MVAKVPLANALFHASPHWESPALMPAADASVAYFQAFWTPSLFSTSGSPSLLSYASVPW
jgi:hypothetical protein